MTFEFDLLEFIARWIARALQGPKGFLPHVKIASLSATQALLSCVDEGFASDIKDIKDIKIQELQAEADIKTEEAKKSANENTLHKRKDKIAQIEKQKKQAEADAVEIDNNVKITDAETRKYDAETRRLQAISDAKIRLVEAISKLRQEGGELILNSENLNEIIKYNLEFLGFDPAPSAIEDDEDDE